MAEIDNLNAPLVSEDQQDLISGNPPSIDQWPEQISDDPLVTDTQDSLISGNIPDQGLNKSLDTSK